MVLPFLLLVPILPKANLATPISGFLTVNAICDRLNESTGEKFDFAANFSDHAVYFRLSDAPPERIKQLTATCLRGQWTQNGKKWRLVANAAPKMPAWFPDAWQKAYDPSKQSKEPQPEPTRLYMLRVGDQEPNEGLTIRRLLGTIYEAGQSQWMVENPLVDVMAWLGERSQKTVKVPEGIKPKPRMGGSSLGAGKGRWTKDGPDPLFTQSGELLAAIADTLGGEVAMPIPDGMAAAGFFFERELPLGNALRSLSQWMELSVSEGVLVGQLTAADAGARTQASRSALIKACNPLPAIFDTPVLAKFEGEQPPLSSISSNDIMALMLGGASIDGTPHYPWDMRLYRSLSNRDWAILRDPNATVGDLSAGAQLAIDKLAQKSRMIFEQSIEVGDGIVPRATAIELMESSDEPFVVYYGDRAPEVTDASNVASQRIWQGYNDKLARFLPIRRRLLTVVIGSSFKIPFTKVEIPADQTPMRYSALPKATRDEITKLETQRRNQQRQQSNPPPI